MDSSEQLGTAQRGLDRISRLSSHAPTLLYLGQSVARLFDHHPVSATRSQQKRDLWGLTAFYFSDLTPKKKPSIKPPCKGESLRPGRKNAVRVQVPVMLYELFLLWTHAADTPLLGHPGTYELKA